MIADGQEYYSLGELAEAAGCKLHQVHYFLRSRGVKPVMRLGGRFRVFGPDTLAKLVEHVEYLKKTVAEAM